jgi:FAD/FMN-containing dehydrogenase
MGQHAHAVENFGGNVAFSPAAAYLPRSEDEVLKILAQQRGKRIRAVGRLHSWSIAVHADEVLIDLRYLNHVQVIASGARAAVGAGCQIKRLLAELDRQGLTLPSVGLISEQTIAGATATGTHGSGKHSLSHSAAEIERLYPHAAHFREICGRYDPAGVFRNDWIARLLFSREGSLGVSANPFVH